MPIVFRHEGDWNKTDRFLKKAKRITKKINLDRYGQQGVELLKAMTPKDTGETAHSWDYRIENSKGRTAIVFTNSNVVDKVPIALVLQYGHATTNGGWVEGLDYINPAIQPLFEEILQNAWREVTRR